MIEKCTWGAMIIHGHKYTSDLMIFPDGTIKDSWWRSRGHRLTRDDIGELLAAGPEIIVAGTGVYGLMKPEASLKQQLEQEGIELVCLKTKPAVEAFNQIVQSARKVAGCFHLTC